jgi:hypothetical protein
LDSVKTYPPKKHAAIVGTAFSVGKASLSVVHTAKRLTAITNNALSAARGQSGTPVIACLANQALIKIKWVGWFVLNAQRGHLALLVAKARVQFVRQELASHSLAKRNSLHAKIARLGIIINLEDRQNVGNACLAQFSHK